MADIQTREPELFASGDSLIFQRYLPGYLPADGWSLHYTFTAPDGQFLLAFDSTASGDSHLVDQDAVSFADSGFPFPIAATLSGFAVNGAERHQIYVGQCLISANLGDATDDSLDGTEPVKTEAQVMLETITASLQDAYRVVYQEVNLSGSRVVWSNITKLREEWSHWKEVRRNEIALARARAGKPSGYVTVPVFCIG